MGKPCLPQVQSSQPLRVKLDKVCLSALAFLDLLCSGALHGLTPAIILRFPVDSTKARRVFISLRRRRENDASAPFDCHSLFHAGLPPRDVPLLRSTQLRSCRSQIGRFDPASISTTHFLGHSFGIIPAPGVFASSAFPVPRQTLLKLQRTVWVPPRMQPLALGAVSTRS